MKIVSKYEDVVAPRLGDAGLDIKFDRYGKNGIVINKSNSTPDDYYHTELESCFSDYTTHEHDDKEYIEIPPNCMVKLATGLCVEIPEGYVGIIYDRSSMGLKGLFKVAGVIDNTYRGEISVVLWNLSKYDITIKHREKIAQLVILPYYQVTTIEYADELSQTERGTGGFGSTGRL